MCLCSQSHDMLEIGVTPRKRYYLITPGMSLDYQISFQSGDLRLDTALKNNVNSTP